MSLANINPETGIRYGVISANSINGFVFQDIFDQVYNFFSELCYNEAIEELKIDNPEDAEDEEKLDEFEQDFFDNFQPEEIWGDFELDGIKGHLSCLGGAYIIFVTESPYTTKAKLCSPCVPNAGDLDSLNENGYTCYDVPPEWKELD